MVSLYGRDLSARELARRTGRLAQVAGISPGEYADGPERHVRFLDIRSGAGLEVRVLVDRGMDIGELRIDGVPVSWRSPTGFRAPALTNAAEDEGAGILRSFDGLLVTCGLDHVRRAATGPAAHFGSRRTDLQYPMHGRIAMAPAELSGHGEAWQGEDCIFWCEGIVRQAMLYGENLVLRRRIEVPLGGRHVEIVDRVENAGFHTVPHMLLYHVNFGFPLLAETAELLLPAGFAEAAGSPARRDALRRQAGPAGPDAPDELLDLHAEGPQPAGPACALVNPDLAGGLAVALDWDLPGLPFLQVWRNLSDGLYVLAVEPAAQPFVPRSDLAAQGALRLLRPGEIVDYRLRLSAHAGAAALDRLRSGLAMA